MKRVGSMTILEHLSMAMEDLEKENILDNPESAKLAIEKARTITNIAATYNEAIRNEQNEKQLIIDAMDVAGKWNYTTKDMKELLKIENNQGGVL